jgi:hypothetical protein
LQRAYHKDLLPILAEDWLWLPDLFGLELGMSPDLSPQDGIQRLGIRHQELTHSFTNWAGTYINVAHHLNRYKQDELRSRQFQASQPYCTNLAIPENGDREANRLGGYMRLTQ